MSAISRVSIVKTNDNLVESVKSVFDAHGGLEKLLNGRTRAVIKVNAVSCHPETYTSPEVLEAVITYMRQCGINDISVAENCTQGNFTRLVFAVTELGKVCRRTGARALFLDEGHVEPVELPGFDSGARFNSSMLKELGIRAKEREVFFLNLPKLKTHSMSVVTLGTKNLLGLMDQRDRMHDHNYNLHDRLASLAELFPPDFTLVDGLKLIYHGHFPPEAVVDECIEQMNILIGGQDMIAVDTVGARIIGYDIEEVKHLHIAEKRRLGCGRLDEIEIRGDISGYTKKYPYTLLPRFPEDVNVYRGEERCCPEGCENNTLAVLQLLYLDHNGKGGFDILMGKGFSREMLENTRGPVLLAGNCAIEEAGPFLKEKYGARKVFTTPFCNDLSSTVKALTTLMKVNIVKMVPVNPLKSLALLIISRLKGGKARVTI